MALPHIVPQLVRFGFSEDGKMAAEARAAMTSITVRKRRYYRDC